MKPQPRAAGGRLVAERESGPGVRQPVISRRDGLFQRFPEQCYLLAEDRSIVAINDQVLRQLKGAAYWAPDARERTMQDAIGEADQQLYAARRALRARAVAS